MSEISIAVERSVAPSIESGIVLTAGEWGMISFLVSEASFFCTLIVVYLALHGAVESGPTSAILSLPLVVCTTICLLLSSLTIHLAERSLRSGAKTAFVRWWTGTILLAIAFLAGTGYEWSNLINQYGLTISRNLFGTTYYTLVGFHALHVSVGVIAMTVMLALTAKSRVRVGKHVGIELVSWYWHFVDGVWLVVFTVVYLVGR